MARKSASRCKVNRAGRHPPSNFGTSPLPTRKRPTHHRASGPDHPRRGKGGAGRTLNGRVAKARWSSCLPACTYWTTAEKSCWMADPSPPFRTRNILHRLAPCSRNRFCWLPPSKKMWRAATENRWIHRRVQQSLERAGLWERVQAMPKRSKIPLLQGVVQRWRKPFGRRGAKAEDLPCALYKDAPVMVLDEPTAALDPLAEADRMSGTTA